MTLKPSKRSNRVPVRTHVDSGDSGAFVEAPGILKFARFKNNWSQLNRSFI